jgi:hypothetical protein
MAKNMLPMAGGSGPVSKLVGVLVLISVAVLVVKYPQDAAHIVTGAAGLLGNIIGGIVTFLRQLRGSP